MAEYPFEVAEPLVSVPMQVALVARYSWAAVTRVVRGAVVPSLYYLDVVSSEAVERLALQHMLEAPTVEVAVSI